MGSVCTLEDCFNLGMINFLRALEDFVFVSLEFLQRVIPCLWDIRMLALIRRSDTKVTYAGNQISLI